MFKNTPLGFVRMLSTSVKHMLYLPNQVIVNKGDIGHEMYFIHKGRVEVKEHYKLHVQHVLFYRAL